jgi:hypothetical protein
MAFVHYVLPMPSIVATGADANGENEHRLSWSEAGELSMPVVGPCGWRPAASSKPACRPYRPPSTAPANSAAHQPGLGARAVANAARGVDSKSLPKGRQSAPRPTIGHSERYAQVFELAIADALTA